MFLARMESASNATDNHKEIHEMASNNSGRGNDDSGERGFAAGVVCGFRR